LSQLVTCDSAFRDNAPVEQHDWNAEVVETVKIVVGVDVG